MDLRQLLATLNQIEQPATEEGCGMSAPAMPAIPPKPETPPPSMSVNINAHGLDNIEDMMKLFTKVNPDMMPPVTPPTPSIDIIPGLGVDKPMGPPEIKPINKLLPDFDAENDDMPGGEMDSDYDNDGKLDPHEKDHASEKPLLKTLDKDNDGDHDMDDHDLEKDDEKKETWANEPDEDVKDISFSVHDGNDQHREKETFPKVAGADNPMQKVKEGGDLRAQIRAELLQRLAEAKGAK